MNLPLCGIKVLDLSRILAGPWCGQILADFGADVVKVERPQFGDETRRWGPPFVASDNGTPADRSAYFCSANRGKRSIALEFSDAQDRDILERLIGQADVLVENFLPMVANKFGLNAAGLRARHPRLIVASIRGFASHTDEANAPAFDAMIQARGGLMHITGEPGGPPQKVGVAVADLFAGVNLAQAVCAALFARERHGDGQIIEVALFDAQLAMLANQAGNALIGGLDPQRLGNAHPNIVPYQSFATLDGHLMVAVGTDAQFGALCDALNQPQWKDDARFADNAARVRHRDALVERLASCFATDSTAVWVSLLNSVSIPCAPVQSVQQALNDPNTQQSGMLQRGLDSALNQFVASPVQCNGERLGSTISPPRLDADRESILSDWLRQ